MKRSSLPALLSPRPSLSARTWALALFGLGALASPAWSQGGPPAPGSREAMWPAPTAEDWEKPCLVTWQRTFEDAIAVSKETRKPILICVNMDGEIASEHYAGIRYRDPEIAALYEPYVTVIASVYRHTPRDYDERGRRIPCPRFGGVTCGEHIAIEPGLFDQYFEGQRVAPRHIMVELDMAETYDVYYAFDTASVFDAIHQGIATRKVEVRDIPRGDRPLDDLVDSRESRDQVAVETAYLEGDREVRERILKRIVTRGDPPQIDVLRLAVYGFDLELNAMAREALAKTDSEAAIGLIVEALRVPMEAEEREALIAALERIGEKNGHARTYAMVFRGLGTDSDSLNAEAWSTSLSEGDGTTVSRRGRVEIEDRLENQVEAASSRPEDPEARLALAESYLALVINPETVAGFGIDPHSRTEYARLMLEDAHRTAHEAEDLGATGWRVGATIALSAYYLEDFEEAYERAEGTVDLLPEGSYEWNAMAVLGLFAESRRKAIARAVRDKEPWPREWLADVHSAYSVLANHPFGTDGQVVAHYDFLGRLGALAHASRVLEAGLQRFPDSWELHARLRGKLLQEQGVEGIESAYAAMLAKGDPSWNLEWFAGYASLVAAEFHRRGGADAEAMASYGRAIERFEGVVAAHPEGRASADHYVAMALAGQARVALEQGALERSLELLLASFERYPDAASSLDGLNISPVGTAQMLRSRARRRDKPQIAERIGAALAGLDPRHLELPAFEGGGNTPPSPDAAAAARRLREQRQGGGR